MPEIATQRFVDDFPLAELVPHPDNPRVHDMDSITESIDANQFAGAIYAQDGTNYILSGHGRVKALIARGVESGPVMFIECDAEQAKKFLLAFNAVGEKSTYDEELLAGLLVPLSELGDLKGTGYNADAVDDLLARAEPFVIPEQEFKGDFAEKPEEREQRSKKVAETKKSQGLREMVLVYDGERYDRLVAALGVISEFHDTDTNAESVFDACINYAKGLEP